MYVACSTLCFGKRPLADAMRSIAEIGFTKVDVAFRESGPHLKPSEIAADINRAVQVLKAGPGLAIAAFHVELAPDLSAEQVDEQIKAICRLARVMAVPVFSVPAAPVGSPLQPEVDRLTNLCKIARGDGISATVETRIGTLTESPAAALELCKAVPGLGITLDPSHYMVGAHAGESYDELFPYVKHVRLRDTSKEPGDFQVPIGQGQIEYGRIVNQLSRCRYNRLLSVDVRDLPEEPSQLQPEVRKLKYLLESLI